MRETSAQPGSFAWILRQLLGEAFESYAAEESPRVVTMCAPRWVLDRVSDETGAPVETNRGVLSVTIDSLVVTAVPALEQGGGLGFLAAVDVIGGRCVEITACHTDVAPDRWPDLTLALAHGLGREVSVAIEMLGTCEHD
ncbi:MAG TPA: hypothetical protein VEH29_15255 [Acidimicrobiales bacterium]|nr:hypothetical protein [Acidimicrobiales bacterium]